MKPKPKAGRWFGNPLGLQKSASRPLPKRAKAVRPVAGKKGRPFARRRFVFTWKKLFVSLGVCLGLFIVAATGVFAYYVRQLPNPKKIESRTVAQSTQLLDRNGTPLYSIHGEENRTVVSGDQISPYLKDATISVEDANFYHHHGFDLRGLARAAAVHLHLLHRDLSGGGSTITQQYIKLALLEDPTQTIDRKLKELILAIEVEQIYSKDEILTGYLNQINYGGSAYGIEAASQTYFNKHAKDLTLPEAATLAAIPNAPSYYTPYGSHLDRLFVRKDYILDRMAENGYITQAQADQAKKEAPSLANPTFSQQSNLVAPHFVFYVREQLADQLDSDPQVAEKMIDEGGYVVTTSLDLPTQNLAQKVLADMGPGVVKRYQATNASLSAVDPRTGEILAMVGSIDYNNSKSGNTNFANALLQPGSTFKPIVYATAFSPGHTYAPSSITYDLSTDFGGGYRPSDYDLKNRGPVTDRQALAGSLNIPAVKNLALVGVSQSIDTAKALGITSLNRPVNDYGLSLVLGSGEVRPIEMADAYAAFADGGVRHPLRPILKIEKNGALVKDFTTDQPVKSVEPEVAYEITSILSDYSAKVPIFGSLAKNLTLPDRPVASKTGTTQNFRDAWTIGYTPSIVCAVWVGNNDPNKTMLNGSDGSVVAAPLWNSFMSQYLKGKPVEQFSRPADIQQVTVDKLSGKLPTDQSPADQQITDIFAPWQVPKDHDDVHVKVKIDKVTGKLATDQTPADDVVEQTFFSVHSEQPDNPNWEQPVQDWAKANGGGTSPPTQSDDLHTDANRPTISITSPLAGSTVSGQIVLSATPGGPQPISKVEFFVNGTSVGAVTQAPWSLTYDTSGLPAGSQIIQATATNSVEMTKSDQVTVTTQTGGVSRPSSGQPPGPVSAATATDGHKGSGQPIRLAWNNPDSPTVTSVNIYQSLTPDPADLGSKVLSVAALPSSQGSASIDVSKLNPGITYYYTLRPVDASGNENQSTSKVAARVLP